MPWLLVLMSGCVLVSVWSYVSFHPWGSPLSTVAGCVSGKRVRAVGSVIYSAVLWRCMTAQLGEFGTAAAAVSSVATWRASSVTLVGLRSSMGAAERGWCARGKQREGGGARPGRTLSLSVCVRLRGQCVALMDTPTPTCASWKKLPAEEMPPWDSLDMDHATLVNIATLCLATRNSI